MPVGARPIQFANAKGLATAVTSAPRLDQPCTAGASEDLRGIRRNLGHVAGKALVTPEIIVEIQATGWRSWELQIDVIAGSTGIPFARK
jgi:hypothetical protein